MKVLLAMSEECHRHMLAHLLPADSDLEQASFLFATVALAGDTMRFDVVERRDLQPNDFAIQSACHLELADATRAGVIKHAHDLGASLIEVHSHRGSRSAEFSVSDVDGLNETVPNMWWRLKKRPYLALVVASHDFDALAWVRDPEIPCALDGLLAGRQLLRPTNRTLRSLRP